jgi:hypothetical protein
MVVKSEQLFGLALEITYIHTNCGEGAVTHQDDTFEMNNNGDYEN